MPHDPNSPDTRFEPVPDDVPVPARTFDARAFLPSFDDRHHHVDLRVAAGSLVGTIDAALLPRLLEWAEEEGLDAVVDGVVPAPAVVARGVRLRAAPGAHAAAVTEVRLGAEVEIVAREGRWRRVRSGSDRYLGWMHVRDVANGSYGATHRVSALRGHLYAAPRVQGDVLGRVAWGDRLQVRDEVRDWSEVRLPDGRTAFLLSDLLTPADALVRVAPTESWRSFLGTPYLWGGGSAWGIDCSGFVQLLHRMAGTEIPRDADEQFAFGTRVDAPEPGDLACFRGHIGLYLGEDRMAHASGRAMRVVETEPFTSAKDRERFRGWVRIDRPESQTGRRSVP